MKIFEIKNGVYNIQQFKEVNDPNYVGTMFVEDGYKVFFLVFDKRYPEDDSILVEADKFSEFKRMFNSTDFCPEGTDNQANNAEEAWKFKRFSEDTNNVAVFEVEVYEALHTNYTYQGCTSTMMK